MVIKQSADVAQMAEKVKQLHDLRSVIAQAQKQERDLTDEVKAYMADEGVDFLDLEGSPACMLRERKTGMAWDSAAIRNLQEHHPKEWERLTDLGAVKLNLTVLREAVKNGNLVRIPPGGIQGTTQALVFEEER